MSLACCKDCHRRAAPPMASLQRQVALPQYWVKSPGSQPLVHRYNGCAPIGMAGALGGRPGSLMATNPARPNAMVPTVQTRSASVDSWLRQFDRDRCQNRCRWQLYQVHVRKVPFQGFPECRGHGPTVPPRRATSSKQRATDHSTTPRARWLP